MEVTEKKEYRRIYLTINGEKIDKQNDLISFNLKLNLFLTIENSEDTVNKIKTFLMSLLKKKDLQTFIEENYLFLIKTYKTIHHNVGIRIDENFNKSPTKFIQIEITVLNSSIVNKEEVLKLKAKELDSMEYKKKVLSIFEENFYLYKITRRVTSKLKNVAHESIQPSDIRIYNLLAPVLGTIIKDYS